MPWWTWIVLWVALLALSALFLIVVGFKVFRKAAATLSEFEATAERLGAVSAGPRTDAVPDNGHTMRAAPAVFSAPENVRRANAEARDLRGARRRERRIRRRAEANRPQLLRDLPHL